MLIFICIIFTALNAHSFSVRFVRIVHVRICVRVRCPVCLSISVCVQVDVIGHVHVLKAMS
jgi:hypothetical protein